MKQLSIFFIEIFWKLSIFCREKLYRTGHVQHVDFACYYNIAWWYSSVIPIECEHDIAKDKTNGKYYIFSYFSVFLSLLILLTRSSCYIYLLPATFQNQKVFHKSCRRSETWWFSAQVLWNWSPPSFVSCSSARKCSISFIFFYQIETFNSSQASAPSDSWYFCVFLCIV